MPFKKFDKGQVGKEKMTDVIGVSQKRKHLHISENLYLEYFNGVSHAEVYFDEETGRVGIDPSPNKGYKLQFGRKGSSRAARVVCSAFIKKYRIASGKYPAEFDEDEGMLIFKPDLQEVSG